MATTYGMRKEQARRRREERDDPHGVKRLVDMLEQERHRFRAYRFAVRLNCTEQQRADISDQAAKFESYSDDKLYDLMFDLTKEE